MSEDQLQAEFFQRVWNEYPQLRRCMWAIPNGGKRDMRTAITLKATGVLSGVWDLHLFYKNRFHIIETKVGRNDLSDKQKEWGATMVANGATAYVYRTIEEGMAIIETIIKN